ncbi:RNA polymerase recycling motor HelD [Virgibacillus byunsanensis]|uniref:RNA polymerase recycling motor HelD n=1 Tax=Virgibacillus byunsanensis TaxID=570945 RepID=A0ABW3LHB7_9BACI
MSNEADNLSVEQQRVDHVIKEISKKEEKLYSRATGLKENVIELRKKFWEDVTINLDEPDDVIETEASIKQQAELLSERESVHGKVGEELKTFEKLKNSPYFGRIDFVEDTAKENDQLYIGIKSLMDYEEENFLIYDWRAPISSLYYDYSPGKAIYETIEGKITGEITLKRQFIIREGLIKGMFDTGVTIGDHLLQQALGHNASTTMKSIVATIQKEQNKIIRNERSDLLVVQGVAGSGKTSAALQRIAYLMYRYREELHADNVVLFSPNPLFTSYISNVLPELGETNIRQETFLDYLEKSVGDNLSVESPFKQMEYVLTENGSDTYAIRMKGMHYKSSLDFKDMIDEFSTQLINDGIQFRNITFRKNILISKEQISDYFYSLEKEIATPNKMELVLKWILKEIRTIQKEEKNKDWVMDQVELLDKEAYLKAQYELQRQDEKTGFDDASVEEEYLRSQVVKKYFSSIKKRVKRFEFVHVLATYRRFFTDWNPQTTPEYWKEICDQTASDLSRKYLTWEDATPYLYFKGTLLGDDRADRSVRHLIIDEAQDYSAFQFAYIQHLFPYTRMTLLGDVNQAIYTYATEENPLIPETFLGNHERITLSKSYRSTKQIVEFTKYFAPGEEVIEPFNREGSKPRIRRNNKEDLAAELIDSIQSIREKGLQTIAIICKTLQESETIYNLLQDEVTIDLINEETYSYQQGLLVLPIYLAKGIEFDAVIIPDASKQAYFMESDRTLFYTACTRAMHELVMVSGKEPCTFIEEAPKDTYEMN